jgi:hypothetical protein
MIKTGQAFQPGAETGASDTRQRGWIESGPEYIRRMWSESGLYFYYGSILQAITTGKKKGAYGRLSRPHCLIILIGSYLLQFLCLVVVLV